MEIAAQTKGRTLWFLLFLVATVSVHFVPLRSLFSFAWDDSTFSYIPVVPLVCAWLLFDSRRRIFTQGDALYPAGAAPIVVAIALYAVGAANADRLVPVDRMAVMALSFVLCFAGGIGLFFGPVAWRAAAFPIFFLAFMIPIPASILNGIVVFLQRWSAEASDLLFRLTGVPVYRDGFTFHLPGQTIEVAKQCSGIRSSISLFLVSLLAGHLFLRDAWRRTILSISIVPITIMKNAVRIVALSLLAVYVDPGILGSVAHQRGGIPIFVLALGLLGVVLWFLRRGERKRSEP